MKLETRARHLSLDPELIEHVEQRVRLALGRLGHRVKRVVVQVSDLNGPRGGVDHHCRVSTHLRRSRPLVTEAVGVDTRQAVSLAVERAGRRAERQVERLQERSSGRRVGRLREGPGLAPAG